MSRFVFDVTGTCGPCCKANIEAWIDIDKQIGSGFTITHVTLSPNYKKLIVHIKEDNKKLEAEVQDYLVKALSESNVYGITSKPISIASTQPVSPPQLHIFWRWVYAGLGLVTGISLLILSLMAGALSFPVTIVMAVCSVILTFVLGIESLRKAKTDFYQLKPGMDSLFALSTLMALGISIAALFVPELPTMFDVGLLIFGFRHLGIAIKETMNTKLATQTQYLRLVSGRTFKKSVDRGYKKITYQALQPGDILHISAGEMIPVDGWLVPSFESDSAGYELDVSIPQGTTHPKRCARDAPVLAGMVAKTSCLMRVGFGKCVVFGVPKQPGDFFEDLHVYAEEDCIKITGYSDKDSAQFSLTLSSQDLTDIDGYDHTETLLGALRHNSMHHLELSARQQLLRGIAQRAEELGLTQTSSFLHKVDEESAEAALTSTPMQVRSEEVLKSFVPWMIVIAMGTGLVLSCFFPAMIALQCSITILVSACPCSLGLIIPLVMEFSRSRAQTEGIMINDTAAIETLHKVDTLVLDLHKTLTQGDLIVEIDPPDSQEINTYLALLERASTHFVGKAIYAKIQGDRCLEKASFQCDPTQVITYNEGIAAEINGERYYLGNCKLMARFGINVAPGAIYLIKAHHPEPLATIKVYDRLRQDASITMRESQRFGFKIKKVATGTDQAIASFYQPMLRLNFDDMHSELSGSEEGFKESKLGLIKKLQNKQSQTQDHWVLMVGDGINDASALQAADVGMVMSYPEGQENLQPKAPIRILHGRGVISVLKAKEIADQAMDSAYQTLWLSLIYNLIAVSLSTVLLLGFGIVLHPGVGAALMVIQICLIIANAYRLSQQPLLSTEILKREGLFPEQIQHGTQASELMTGCCLI